MGIAINVSVDGIEAVKEKPTRAVNERVWSPVGTPCCLLIVRFDFTINSQQLESAR